MKPQSIREIIQNGYFDRLEILWGEQEVIRAKNARLTSPSREDSTTPENTGLITKQQVAESSRLSVAKEEHKNG